jgi:hypothetical protein
VLLLGRNQFAQRPWTVHGEEGELVMMVMW